MRLRRAAACVLLAVAAAAHADYDKAMAAAKRGDAAGAFTAMRAAAQAGDERAFAPLALQYAQGAGTSRDLRAALGWARKSAAQGRADGEFALYAIIISRPDLNYVDGEGRINQDRYRSLAARPITEREDEMTAYDSLGRAAAKGHREAALSLAGFYADNVGEGNRRQAEAIIDKVPGRPPVFDQLRKRLAELDAIGPTLMTDRLHQEVAPELRKVAQATAAAKDKAKAECNAIKPVRAQRMGAVVRPIWLPLAVEEMKTAYLMSGEWRERWTMDVCGAETVVQVQFTADGLGSATFAVEPER